MFVIKRDGTKVNFQKEKIENAIKKCLNDVQTYHLPFEITEAVLNEIGEQNKEEWSVEEIQDLIEKALMSFDEFDAAKKFILYRAEHKNNRELFERIDYMDKYAFASNAADGSETDPNSNSKIKNVASLEGEVFKTKNREIQRARMKKKLKELYPEVADNYIQDIENHVIYIHDEASSPVPKFYCQAVSLYPLMTEGVGNMDGTTPFAPNDLSSFSGQLTNLIFTLSSQAKGAVAVGGYFVALNYYCIKEFGEDYYLRGNDLATSPNCKIQRTIADTIRKAFKTFVWGINQPAGNRSYGSPFTNISYFDKYYFDSLFGLFVYPDGTKPKYEAVNYLQKLFMKFFNKLRLQKPVAFPVETAAMLYDEESKEFKDKEFVDFCSEMLAEGHSFFSYISSSPDSLASCCKVRNEITDNTFSPTSGLTGLKTGSCNVITLNINRIVQNWYNSTNDKNLSNFQEYLIKILERVYKYQIAYKSILYDYEAAGMFTCSNAGYISMNKLYSTIGILGYNEAALFLGMNVSYNEEYVNFLKLILGTLKEQNKLHSIYKGKRKVIFNSEAIPGESCGVKLYNWDKKDGYVVPSDRNLYNGYFYEAHDNTSILDKFRLHGGEIAKYSDGGQGVHANLQEHLTKEQYRKMYDFAAQTGTSYFCYNIPNSECADCHHIEKKPISKCPICGSDHIKTYTRIVGYLTCTDSWQEARKIEGSKRVYSKEV